MVHKTVNQEQYELRLTPWALTGKEGGAAGTKHLCYTHKMGNKDAVRGAAGRAAACMDSEDTEQGDNHTGELLRNMVKVDSHGPHMDKDTVFDV